VADPGDTEQVLQAIRLGWYMAEVRGRNRPNGPTGGKEPQPPRQIGEEPPLRVERNRDECRIEAQQVVMTLASSLKVDEGPAGRGSSYSVMIDNQAHLLWTTRASDAVAALQTLGGPATRAVKQLTQTKAAEATAAAAVAAAKTAADNAAEVARTTAELAAEAARTAADLEAKALAHATDESMTTTNAALTEAAADEADATKAAAEAAATAATAANALQQKEIVQQAAHQKYLNACQGALAVIGTIEVELASAVVVQQKAARTAQSAANATAVQTPPSPGPDPDPGYFWLSLQRLTTEQAVANAADLIAIDLQQAATQIAAAHTARGANAAEQAMQALSTALAAIEARATLAWADLADLFWRFDAKIQDRLSAASDTQATGYQLGRGLAEMYWALDPPRAKGFNGWETVLGETRCRELNRLNGRLSAYMGTYTAPAVAGSLDVWSKVGGNDDSWRQDGRVPAEALYKQTRRWYELIVLRQDPTTLIKPYDWIRNYRAIGRAALAFLPQLLFTIAGLAGLVAFILLLQDKRSAVSVWLSALLAAGGLSTAGITAFLKNSAQALVKRLRQDAFADLLAVVVTEPPPNKNRKAIQSVLHERRLTVATER